MGLEPMTTYVALLAGKKSRQCSATSELMPSFIEKITCTWLISWRLTVNDTWNSGTFD